MAEVIEVKIKQASEQEQRGREGPAIYIFCYSNNNVYIFFISLIDIKPKMGQINIRKK